VAPDDAVPRALFARFQLSRGLKPQATRLVSQALTLDPECPEALVVQGKIMGERGMYGDARAVLEKAVALAPDNADAQHELGVWFFRVNLFDRAAHHFESAVALNRFRTRSLDYLAISLEMLGEGERAEEMVNMIIASFFSFIIRMTVCVFWIFQLEGTGNWKRSVGW